MTGAHAHVCIVGGGVMGAAAAFELASQGVDVLVLDQSVPGGEASGATPGTLALQNKRLDAIPMAIRALEQWEDLSERLGEDVEYEQRGGFRVAHTEQEVRKLEEDVAAQRAVGVPVELVYQPQLATAAPYLSALVRAAGFCPRDGMANPMATVRAFLRAACRAGARLWSHCRVDAIEVRKDRDFIVRTARGPVQCSALLAAAGAWNLEVARMLGIELPISTEVLQALVTDSVPPLFPHIVTHVRGNLTLKQRRVSGKILIGGAWRGEGDRESGRKVVLQESVDGNLRAAIETVPAIARSHVLRSWVGFEGRTPDRLLLCGPLGPPGSYILGCAAGGFTLAPLAGQIAADFLVNGNPRVDWDQISAQRFLNAPAPLSREPRIEALAQVDADRVGNNKTNGDSGGATHEQR